MGPPPPPAADLSFLPPKRLRTVTGDLIAVCAFDVGAFNVGAFEVGERLRKAGAVLNAEVLTMNIRDDIKPLNFIIRDLMRVEQGEEGESGGYLESKRK